MRGAVHFPLGPSCMMTTLTELKSDVLDSRPSVWPVIRDRLNRIRRKALSAETSVRSFFLPQHLIHELARKSGPYFGECEIMPSYLGREEWFAVRGAVRREHGVVPLGLRIFSLELGDVRLA